MRLKPQINTKLTLFSDELGFMLSFQSCADIRDESSGGACCAYTDFDFVNTFAKYSDWIQDCTDSSNTNDNGNGACCTYADFEFVKKEMPLF